MHPQKYVIEGQSLKTGKWEELYHNELKTQIQPRQISFLWWKWMVQDHLYEVVTEEQDNRLREQVQAEALQYIDLEIYRNKGQFNSIRIVRYYWIAFEVYQYWWSCGTVWQDGKWI